MNKREIFCFPKWSNSSYSTTMWSISGSSSIMLVNQNQWWFFNFLKLDLLYAFLVLEQKYRSYRIHLFNNTIWGTNILHLNNEHVFNGWTTHSSNQPPWFKHEIATIKYTKGISDYYSIFLCYHSTKYYYY